MRILLLSVFLTFFVFIPETPAQTGSTEITPDTRLCWYQPFKVGGAVHFPFVSAKIPASTDPPLYCSFMATCNEVLSFKKVRRGNLSEISIPQGPKHQSQIKNAAIHFTDCRDYGADEATKIIGKVVRVYQRVEVLSKGRGQRWKRIPRGYELRQGDTLRTGPRGRTRLDFGDDNRELNVINIGSNTTVKVDLLQERINKKEPKTIFSLIRGTLRSLFELLPSDSKKLEIRSSPTARLQIRTPSALIEKIGTDFAVNYDPNTKATSVFLDHGKVNIKSGGRQVALEPRTSVKVVNNRIGQPQRMSQSIWNDLIVKTTGETEEDPLDFFKPDGPDKPVKSGAFNREATIAWLFARETVDKFLNAMKNNDQTTVLGVTSGFLRSVYLKEIKKLGSLRAMLNKSGQRPDSWTHECSVCTKSGNSCMVMVSITNAGTRKTTKIIFTIENKKVTDARPAWGESLRKFRAQKPVCGENDVLDDL